MTLCRAPAAHIIDTRAFLSTSRCFASLSPTYFPTLDPSSLPEQGTICLRQLTGHRGPVLALAVSSAGLLASASEDGTARLWDVQGARSLRMASVGPPINSVIFGPKEQLYLAAGSAVLTYDLRKPDVILRTFDARYVLADEEINQISLNMNGSLLAIADDASMVTVAETAKDFAVLWKFPNSDDKAICTSVQFSPVQRTQLFSGGFNAIVQSWDVVKRKALGSLPCSAPSAQLINPAFIHRVSTSADGTFVAAALGDGSVIVAESASMNALMRLDEVAGHKSAVSQVIFPAFSPRNHLLSASDDCRIILWNVQRQSKKSAPSSRIQLKIVHTHKINWIESSASGNLLFVGDSSNNISMYTVPLPP